MNKRMRGIRRLVCLILTWAILGNSVGVPQVYAQEPLGEATVVTKEGAIGAWDGVTREITWDTDHCQITFQLTDYWTDGYTAMVTIQNKSDTPVENWHVAFPMEDEIKDLWNAQIVEHVQEGTVFKNVGCNQDIASGQSIQFGFTAAGAFTGFPEICELPATLQAVSGGDVELTYEVTDSWENGFNGSINIINTSGRTIEDWQISFDWPCEITDLWEGQIVSHENNKYVVNNNTYNQNIAPDGSVRINFTVQNGNADSIPTAYLLEEVTLGEYTGVGDGENADEENKPEEDVSGGDVSGGDLEKVILTIDTTTFDLNEAWEMYLTQEKLSGLSGTLTGVNQVEKLTFRVTDINETVVDSGEIPVQTNWEITPFGLALGTNCITVTAHLAGGKTVEEEIYLMNFNEENMEAADLDLSDSDGDGINNYFETIFGTEMLLEDTDGDGLKDFDEMTKTGTDPGLMDTDGNGVNDNDEDFDEDGLTNLEEMAAGSGPLYPDTDNDGLKDGAEVKVHFTDPIVEDFDQDGLKDGEDVRLGYDPTNPDTDGDGILDGDEILYQTYTKELDQEKKAGITQVSVSMDCPGCIDNEVYIHNVYNLDMRTTDVVGLFGAPVAIEAWEEFDEATITFTYDEAALGETTEDNLRIMWYDKENDKYIILDDETVLDKENNTLSYTTDHFSTWLVVDRTIWYDALRQDINYRTGGDVIYYDIALAVDVSLSMQNDDRFPLAKSALNSLIDGMLEGDRAGLIKYNKMATVVQPLTKDQELLKSGVNSLSLQYGNDADMGISAGINMLQETDGTNRRMLVLICDGDVKYNASLVQSARTNQIPIYCINVVNGNADAMESIAINTGGQYYYAATSEDIQAAMAELKGDTVSYVDETDSDGDGLYDVYEINGMRMSNNTIVYTDPFLEDTDGDGINDYQEMGGEPVEITYTVGGKTFTSVMNPGALYDKLSRDFMYVDGRPNLNGMVVDSKMNYVPYLDGRNKVPWYIDDNKGETTFLGETREYKGYEGLNGLFADKADEISLAEKTIKYDSWNTAALCALAVANARMPLDCFYTFCKGEGGPNLGIESRGTRKYVEIPYVLFGGSGNTVNTYFKENMYSMFSAAKAVLNENNREVYIAVAPEANWGGCKFLEEAADPITEGYRIISNVPAFAAFNSADAVATLHCVYDPETEEYYGEYEYYLTDYYDFSFARTFEEQVMLGYAKSYELYGETSGVMKVNDNQSLYAQIPYLF